MLREKMQRLEQMSPEERAAFTERMKQRQAAERKEMMQMTREAKVSMEQAIQIAQSQQAGTVLESRLTRERGQATYIITVLSGDENNSTTTRFLISAGDGKVMDTFREPHNNNE